EGWTRGDRVFVNPLVLCGECDACTGDHPTQCRRARLPGLELPGLFSDLISMPAKSLHRLPDSITWEEGALIEPASVAYHAIGRGELKPRDRVAILGAGPIGALAALILDRRFNAQILV